MLKATQVNGKTSFLILNNIAGYGEMMMQQLIGKQSVLYNLRSVFADRVGKQLKYNHH
jgi:hypothetical protein